jgi:signal peptidase II
MVRSNNRNDVNAAFCFLLLVFVIAIDQATKWSVLAFFPRGSSVSICPFINLVLTINFGTSFGLLSPSTQSEHLMLVSITIFCIALLLYFFFKLKTETERIFCALLIGGAIGNLLDRFFHGGVIDFIDVYYRDWHWPAFNIADSFISCSAIGLIIYNLFSRK